MSTASSLGTRLGPCGRGVRAYWKLSRLVLRDDRKIHRFDSVSPTFMDRSHSSYFQAPTRGLGLRGLTDCDSYSPVSTDDRRRWSRGPRCFCVGVRRTGGVGVTSLRVLPGPTGFEERYSSLLVAFVPLDGGGTSDLRYEGRSVLCGGRG